MRFAILADRSVAKRESMSHPIADLLKRALLVGAMEVRLVPGRRTIVVLPQGESEVKGDPQTPEKITSLLAPILTPAARQHLATGFAEWDFDLEGRGPVRACATCARAASRLARPCLIWSSITSVLICARICPRATRSLTSASTRSIRPDTSEPTSTWLVGRRLPVAVTSMSSERSTTFSVMYCGFPSSVRVK